ncbi:hypothetical protein ACFLU6_14485, partial [Acidobacteriota bacterium]
MLSDGRLVMDEPLIWPEDKVWRGEFKIGRSGRYILSLTPGGAYAFDDRAVIDLGESHAVLVDWQLEDRFPA